MFFLCRGQLNWPRSTGNWYALHGVHHRSPLAASPLKIIFTLIFIFLHELSDGRVKPGEGIFTGGSDFKAFLSFLCFIKNNVAR